MVPKTRASLDVRRAERAFEGVPTLPAPGDVLAYVPDLPDASKHLLDLCTEGTRAQPLDLVLACRRERAARRFDERATGKRWLTRALP